MVTITENHGNLKVVPSTIYTFTPLRGIILESLCYVHPSVPKSTSGERLSCSRCMCRYKEKAMLAARLSSCFSLPLPLCMTRSPGSLCGDQSKEGHHPPGSTCCDHRIQISLHPVPRAAGGCSAAKAAGHLEEVVALGSGWAYTGGKRETEIGGSSCCQLQLCPLHWLSPSFPWKLNLQGSTGFCCRHALLFSRMHCLHGEAAALRMACYS